MCMGYLQKKKSIHLLLPFDHIGLVVAANTTVFMYNVFGCVWCVWEMVTGLDQYFMDQAPTIPGNRKSFATLFNNLQVYGD